MMFEKDPISQILFPTVLTSLAVAGFFFFQTILLVNDRIALHDAYVQQDKAIEQVEKVRTQVSTLIKGLLSLSQQGDKNAQAIIDDMKKAGINFQDQPKAPAAPAQ